MHSRHFSRMIHDEFAHINCLNNFRCYSQCGFAADEEVSVDYTTQAETSKPVTRSETPEPSSKKDGKVTRSGGFLWTARVVGTVYGDDNLYSYITTPKLN
jgi:hypothetical protein